MLPDHRLPHGWNISAAGYAVPPIPEGDSLRAYINQRRRQLTPAQVDEPGWALGDPALCLPLF